MSSDVGVDADPVAAVAALTDARDPYIIGIRHHSPGLATVLPELLARADPEVVCIELPGEAARWLSWLAHEDTVAPVALAGAADGGHLAFYPFADYSPELVALRWAAEHGVQVTVIDLPLGDPAWRAAAYQPSELTQTGPRLRYGHRLTRAARTDGVDTAWDRLIEVRAPDASAEEVRRAAIAFGWALRADVLAAQAMPTIEYVREAWMRRCLRQVRGQRAVAVVGAFHAAGLLADADDAEDPDDCEPVPIRDDVATSLVVYTDAMLDQRSGYPSGITDPGWQEIVARAGGRSELLREAVGVVITQIGRRLRATGHPVGPGEIAESVRMAGDLANLRGLAAPGRLEMQEAIASVFAEGDRMGRGRAVRAAVDTVLRGGRRGQLPNDVPRSGLFTAVERDLAAARLPGPDSARDAALVLGLDPLRSELDRKRHVLMHRLRVARIVYATPVRSLGASADPALGAKWRVEWTLATSPSIEVAATRGVTVVQAAESGLRQWLDRLLDDGRLDSRSVLLALEQAADAGLAGLVGPLLEQVVREVPHDAELHVLLAAADLAARMQQGHLPGLSYAPIDSAILANLHDECLDAAMRSLDGLAGSHYEEDALTVAQLARRHGALGLRLRAAIRRLAEEGSPLMQGTAIGLLVGLEVFTPVEAGARAAGRLDGPDLRAFLTGFVLTAGAIMESGDALAPLADRIEAEPDRWFVERLPALRAAFDGLSPADRQRLLRTVADRHDEYALDVEIVAEELTGWVQADQVGWDAVEQLQATGGLPAGLSRLAFAPLERWRLILGQPREDMTPPAARMSRALDEICAANAGESAGADSAASEEPDAPATSGNDRGGNERPYPSAREWAAELTELFGREVCEALLADAAAAGRTDALLALDPEQVRPSVDLLAAVLALSGAVPESQLAHLRILARRLTEDLIRVLAVRLQPALTGIALPRPTRRPTGRLDLAATVRANLATARRMDDGSVQIVPERPIYRTLGRRSSDWRLLIVVDVSGSMEASTVYAALTAAVLAGVPSFEVQFVAFSTEIVDLSHLVSDPLALLLEVRVGGGTAIRRGLAYARSRITVPSRTLVVLITDFREGGPLGPMLDEVRALAASGVRLLGCAALDDRGTARYATGVATQVVAAGMPVAAVSPTQLARWVAEVVGHG